MESDIQDGLEDLGFDGALVEEGALTAAVQGEKLKSEFMTLCVWLVKEMKGLCNIQENVSEKEDEETFRMEMSGLLTEMGCPHSHLSGVEGLSTPSNRLLLLDYLTSELQAMRMIGGEDEEMEVEDQSVSPALQQILTILTALDLPQPTGESTVFELFSKIESKVRQLLTKGPKDHLGTPLLAKNPSPKQWSKLDEINTQLNQEYTLRRSMLLKRLDVTIQSFGWSDRAKVKKDEISAAFHPLRKSLSVRSPVSIPDIIAARSDLLRLIKTSGAEMRGRTQCRINKIMMGKVPDRGGRPSNVAPPIEMPSFKKRTEAPRDQRPSHRDSGGRGGRGGKVQGGWNSSTGGEGGGGGGGGGRWRDQGADVWSLMAASAGVTSSVGRNTNRSRSPSDRYIIPRLSLQNNDDVELSPRAPLSPRGNPPAAPYMSSTPRSVSADNLHKPLERISPRFGPRDENHPERPPSQNGRLVSGKRSGGSALTSSSSSASKIRTALREHSASSVRSTARERRPNPLLGNSPPARTAAATNSPGKVNQSRTSDSGSSSGSSEHSGPSLGSKTVTLRSGAVTPSTSTTSLVVHGGQRIPAGAAGAAALMTGEELRRMSCDGSARSCPEGHPRSSVPISTTGSEDFQGLSQGGPLPPVETEDLEVSPRGSEQVEFLCQKAQSLVRQMGAALSFDGACSRPPSARSSPCIKVSPPLASPCTPCNRGDGLQSMMKFSPGNARAVLPDITNLQREDLTELKHRLSQVEQALKLGQPASSSEVLKLRGRMQTVESELLDVRTELKEVRIAVSRFTEKPGETKIAQPVRACHPVMASPMMPSKKENVGLPSEPTTGGQAALSADPTAFDKTDVTALAVAPPSPRKQLPAPIAAATYSPFPQTRAGLASPGACFMQRMTMHFPPQQQVINQPPQTVRVHPALRPPTGLVIPQPVPLHLGQWPMTPAAAPV